MNAKALLFISVVLAWGALAALAGAAGFLGRLPSAGPQILIAGLTVGFSLALLRVGPLRSSAAAVSTRAFLAVHGLRLVGAWFLWLQAQGRIPAEFAQRAGWGDIVAAVAALGLLALPDGPVFRRALVAWNIFGAADLFVAVGTATWLNLTRPGSMVELTRLPLTLVPLWLVPVLLSTHLLMLRRSLCPTGAGPGPAALPGPA